MIVKEYVVKETSFDQLNDIITELFGSDYEHFVKTSPMPDWHSIYHKANPGHGFQLPCAITSSQNLWSIRRDSINASWADDEKAVGDCTKIKFYKEEGKYIYVTAITSDNKEHYAGGFLEKSSSFIWVNNIFYDYGTSDKLIPTPRIAENYISLAPFFNPFEKLENPDYTDIFIPAIRPSLDGAYTVFNINGEKYATMSRNIFVKLKE